MTEIHEIVVFKLRADADVEAFRRDIPATDQFLRERPGFIDRTLLHEQDGERWVDMVRWASVEDAMSAFAEFERTLGNTAFVTAIDPDSVVAVHAHA